MGVMVSGGYDKDARHSLGKSSSIDNLLKEERAYYGNMGLFEKIKGGYQHWKYCFKLGSEDLIQRFKDIKQEVKRVIKKYQ